MPASGLFRALSLSVVICICLYGLMLGMSDFQASRQSIAGLGGTAWAALLGLSLANYFLRYARWEGYLRQHGHRLPPVHSAMVYFSGFALTTTPGKIGETVRSLYLHLRGVPYARSLAMLFSERLLDIAVLAIMILLAINSYPDYVGWLLKVLAVIGVLILAVNARAMHRRLEQLVTAMLPRKYEGLGVVVGEVMQDSRGFILSRSGLLGLALGLLAWGVEGYAFYLILQYLDTPLPLLAAAGCYALGTLAGALTMIPGGLGSTEAALVLLLALFGVDTPTAIAAAVICRLTTLWFAVLLGALCLLLVESRREPDPSSV